MTSKPPSTAMLDSNILYPAAIRDILLQIAAEKLFRPRWSPDVLREWMAVDCRLRPDHNPAKVRRTQQLMEQLWFEGNITGYDHRIGDLALPDKNDRHVLAAAIQGGCDAIVTQNLGDFPISVIASHGMDVYHPDDFLSMLIDQHPHECYRAARTVRLRLKNPPYTVAEYLANLETVELRKTAMKLRQVSYRL